MDIDFANYGDLLGLDKLEPLTERCDDKKSIPMAVLIILIVIVGLFGNAIVFFVILVLKEYKKSVSNWYVLQLAVADTIFLLMLPFIASEDMAGKWGFSENLCKAKEGIIMVNYYASILFLMIMSFDRYIAVTRSGVSPWANALRRLDSAALISLGAWCISVCLAVPLYLYSHVTDCQDCSYNFPVSGAEKCEQAGQSENECQKYLEKENSINVEKENSVNASVGSHFNISLDDLERLLEMEKNISPSFEFNSTCKHGDIKSHQIWLYLNFAIMLVLPLVLICMFYGLILRAMMGTTTTASSSQRQYRRRVTLMVLALVTLFAVSWVPWYAVNLAKVRGISVGEAGCRRLANFARIMTYLNSALNPYFYSFMGSRFHQRFLRARTTATRKSRVLHFFSRVSWAKHDGSHSHSGGGVSCRNSKNGKDSRMARVKSQSDDESFNTKTNMRTERTVVDTTPASP